MKPLPLPLRAALPWALAWLFGVAAGAGEAAAQEPAGWNDERVLQLVRRARDVRRSAVVDSTFRSYRAQARGFVYFFMDRPDSGERTLVKADQIALQLSWAAPDRTAQRIVGLRDEKVLPTNIRYHLDHLTVVQDDFGDRIRLGDGDEVAAVTHPMAPLGPGVYDYRLADSLSIRFGGGEEEVRVYEVEVRPRAPDAPGFIGSVYVDRTTAAIVRMRFTFTPASYVDPYLDYIRISLDNSLQDLRHWLPYRQEVELRREMPQLDFLAGSVIRGRFEIGDYELNVDLPAASFPPYRVTAAPDSVRRSFPFERGLFDDLDEQGLAPPPSLDEIQTTARRIVAGRALSGLAPLRLHVPSVSEVARVDRAEGAYLGAGVHLRLGAEAEARLSGGYAFGREKPAAAVDLVGAPAALVPFLEGSWNALRDIGPLAATAPLFGSFGATFFDEDWLDPYFATGVRVGVRDRHAGTGPEVALRVERQRSGTVVLDRPFRAVRPIEEGWVTALELAVPLPLPAGGEGRAVGTAARLGGRSYGTARGWARWSLAPPGSRWGGTLRADAGVSTASAPPQARFLLGGAGTLPGYAARGFQGRAFWLVRLEGSHPLLHPWVGLRAFAALGATHLADPDDPPAGWTAPDSDGPRASVGAGLTFGWEVLRLDVARGVRDGRWEVVFSVEPRFYPFL